NVRGFCLPYLEHGFVVANVEYRLAAAATAPAAVTDVLDATHWFYDNASKYGVDLKRIAVTGESAGGHLALMVGMNSSDAKLGPVTPVASVVDVYGVTDLTDALFGPSPNANARTWIPEQPGRAELAARLSPVNLVRKKLPSILIIHGDKDEAVPYQQAKS